MMMTKRIRKKKKIMMMRRRTRTRRTRKRCMTRHLAGDDGKGGEALEDEILQYEGAEHTIVDRLPTAPSIDDYLMDLVLRLAHFLTTKEYEDGRSSSTLLIYFSGVLGISADGATFKGPLNYTPKLLEIIHCIRLILLESVLPRFAHAHIGWKERPLRGQLDLLNSLRVEKMCLGSQVPMGELLSLHSYSSISRWL
jgi:hypothetical protein